MGKILSRESCDKIKAIRTGADYQNAITQGWMCEGSDDNCICVFNNDTDESVIADYHGNIKSNGLSATKPEDILPYIKAEGVIAIICNCG